MEPMFDQMYCQGYFAGCQDMLRAYEESVGIMTRINKRMTAGMLRRLFNFLITNHIILREDPDISLAWNADREKWAFFNSKEGKTVAIEE